MQGRPTTCGARECTVNQTPSKKAEPARRVEFEKSLARLEEVVRRLENANLTLDDAMKLFEEGVTLTRDCQKQLEEAEGRVEILLKKADGKMTAVPFDPEKDNGA
jgi:exodeoxyribonuclease VII small subunit